MDRNKNKEEIMADTRGIKLVSNGPGEVDLVTALLRGGNIEITLEGGKRYTIKVERRLIWDLTGDKIQISPGVFVPLPKGSNYSVVSHHREISLEGVLTENIACGHLMKKGTRFCPVCGADGADMT